MMRPDDTAPDNSASRAVSTPQREGVSSGVVRSAGAGRASAAKRPLGSGPPRAPRVVGAVAVGGIVGALARAELEVRFPVGSGFPWTTLAINLAGAALLAWVVVRVGERLPPSTYPRAVLGN